MNKDLNYIIKRVIVGVLIGVILFSIKSCNVKAESCTSTTSNLFYYNSSGTKQTTSSQSVNIPNNSYRVGLEYTNSNIKNNRVLLRGTLKFTMFGDFRNYNPIVYAYYGTSSNNSSITNKCKVSKVSYCSEFADICTETTFEIFFSCDNTGTNTSANYISIISTTGLSNGPGSMGLSLENYCVYVSPSNENAINNNTNYESQKIIGNMYGLYQSLWDKTNVMENNIQDNIDSTRDALIQNQNENTEEIIKSQYICSRYSKDNIKKDNYYLDNAGNEISSSNMGLSDYIDIEDKIVVVETPQTSWSSYYCIYNAHKDLISCDLMDTSETITFNTRDKYIRIGFNKIHDKPIFSVCQNGTQAIKNYISDTDVNIDMGVGDNGVITILGTEFEKPGLLTTIFTIPLYFIDRLRTYTDANSCPALHLDSNVLPFHHFINYGNGFDLPCIRNLIEFDVGFSYYETIGTICGGFLILGYFVYRGKKVMKMYSFESNDEGVWGGLQ